jgi:hypothetical protein
MRRGARRVQAFDAYLAARERLGVPAGAAIVFEDSPSGVAAAGAGGIECVMVPNPMTSLVNSNADLIVGSLTDVVLADLRPRPACDVGHGPAIRDVGGAAEAGMLITEGPARRTGANVV